MIELMVTIAILGVLMVVAAPGIGELIKNNRIATQTNDVFSMLAYARAEAMRRGARVAVCPSTDGASCAGSNWSTGLIAFADADQDGVVDDAQNVLRVIPALSGGNTIAASGFTSNFVHFRGSGIATPSGSIKICDDRPAQGRIIAVSPTGSIKLTKDVTCP